jgi:hypothetical protein
MAGVVTARVALAKVAARAVAVATEEAAVPRVETKVEEAMEVGETEGTAKRAGSAPTAATAEWAVQTGALEATAATAARAAERTAVVGGRAKAAAAACGRIGSPRQTR